MPSDILIGVTGGISAFKTAQLVSRLVKDEHRVQVVMTHSARRFVGSATFAALSSRPVPGGSFDPRYPLGAHIELAKAAQLMCVAPASADFLAKAALGIADDLLSTLMLAFAGPVLLAPAMNTQMWSQPAVQRNVTRLREDGRIIIEPGAGWLSCRDVGAGRMAEPDEIAAAIDKGLADGP